VNIDDNTARELLDVLHQLRDVLKKSGDILEHSAEVLIGDDETVEQVATRGQARFRAGEAANWTSFLAEHPELEPEPVTFTDDELVAAVAEAEKQWAARGLPTRGASANFVACVLADFPILAGGPKRIGDVVRVGRALARLGREGRLVAASRPWEGKRWTLAEAA
jgi:hypothetical protein